jgi:hypothetical protein
VAVGDQLHLDMPGAGDQPLQEHHIAPEGAQRFLAGPVEHCGQLRLRGHHPDSPPAAADRRLEHQRVPDPVCVGAGVVQGRQRAVAPRRDRDAGLLGQPLGADLVPENAHRLGRGPDERHPEPVAQFGERRVLRDEPPAHPGGVRACLDQGALEHCQIEIGPGGGRPQGVRLIGLTDEHRMSLAVGVQGDGRDRVPLAPVQVPDGVDQPHRCLAAVHDRDPSHVAHRPPPPVRLLALCLIHQRDAEPRAVPCRVVLCRAVPCCAVLCRVVLCRVVLCRAVSCLPGAPGAMLRAVTCWPDIVRCGLRSAGSP